MSILVILFALFFLMFVAYRGFSVIIFAPIAALLAVLLTEPSHVLPFYSGVFMDKMAGFVKLYFPVFLLGAIFGKVIEMSGFAKSIALFIIRLVGERRSILAIVLVGAVLTYGGVSLFVVAFAVYPFAAELFKASNLPKRLIPATIALGAFTFTMDAYPGTPQIQNVIPTTFFKTTIWAAPWLGFIGGTLVLVSGLLYLQWRCQKTKHEGYGDNHKNEPDASLSDLAKLPNPYVALLPLIAVWVMNKLFTSWMPIFYPQKFNFATIGVSDGGGILDPAKLYGIWSVECALLLGIFLVLVFGFKAIKNRFNIGINLAVAGSLLATLNTASEYGFGGVIASLPGFESVKHGIGALFSNPLVNEAVSVSTLAGITGSASGGMSIALATMGQFYLEQAQKFGIHPEVLHRVASMASGGMDTLPHNGAVITLLAITGLTHKESYKDIFALTLLKTSSVFVIIAIYYIFGIV
jgi:H+/gluconate symporter-like permease